MAEKDYNPFDPEQNRETEWDTLFAQRTPGMSWRPFEIRAEKIMDNAQTRPFREGAVGSNLDPRPDLASRLDDQRGLTLPELDLQARFMKSRGLGPWDPEGPQTWSDREPPPLNPMAEALGANDIGSQGLMNRLREEAAAKTAQANEEYVRSIKDFMERHPQKEVTAKVPPSQQPKERKRKK